MNKYGSKNTVLTAKAVAESVITPPNDYTVPLFGYSGLIDIDKPDTNFILKSVAVNCNFADGLVWKNPYSQFIISWDTFRAAPGTYKTGTVSGVAGQITVTGVGTLFLAEIAPGAVLSLGGILYTVLSVQTNLKLTLTTPIISSFTWVVFFQYLQATTITGTWNSNTKIVTVTSVTGLVPGDIYTNATRTEFFQIDSVGALQFTASQYPQNSGSSLLTLCIGGVGPLAPDTVISQLNTPQPIDTYISPAYLSTSEAVTNVLILPTLKTNGNPILLMTKSINTAFAASTCFFDIDVEIEYTP